jgi:hypothetical protein
VRWVPPGETVRGVRQAVDVESASHEDLYGNRPNGRHHDRQPELDLNYGDAADQRADQGSDDREGDRSTDQVVPVESDPDPERHPGEERCRRGHGT